MSTHSRQEPGSILCLSLDLFSLGGIQRYNRYELRALRTLLPEVDISACSFAAPNGRGFEEPLDVDLIGRGSSVLAKLEFAARVWRLARQRRARLIICDHVNVAPIAYAYHLLTGTPYWVHVHAFEVWGQLSRPRLAALARADRLVSGAQFTRRYLADRYPHLADRLVVGGDVVDCARFTPGPPDPALLAELGLADRPRILTVSRLTVERSKGHDVVLEAMVRLRAASMPLTYLIAGDGPDRPRLERLARDHGLEDAVVFLGNVQDEALPAIYRLCDVFVLASRFSTEGATEGEGIPLVVLEAQSSGRPAVTGKYDGSAESLVDEQTGLLIDSADPDAIATALQRLVSDPDLRARMGRAARVHAEELFSIPAYTARLGRLLRDAAPVLMANAPASQYPRADRDTSRPVALNP